MKRVARWMAGTAWGPHGQTGMAAGEWLSAAKHPIEQDGRRKGHAMRTTYRAKCLLPEGMTGTHDMLAFAEGEDWK